MKLVAALSLIIVLAQTVMAEADCSSQAIAPGTYVIVSAIGDGRCIDKKSQDAESVQFIPCNGSRNQQFKFGEKDANGCYRINSVSSSDRYLVKTGVLGGVPEVLAEPSVAKANYDRWLVRATGDGNFNLLLATDGTECMDRRDPDDQGRAQVITCTGVIQQKFSLQVAQANKAAKSKNAKSKE